MSIFGHEIWNFKKRPKVAYALFFYRRGVEINLIFTLRVAVFEIRTDFENLHYIWVCDLEFEERFQSCICTLFLPQRVKLQLMFALRAAFVEIRADFQIAIFGHETWNLKKSDGGCIWTTFLLQGVDIELIFALRAAVFEIEQLN